MQTSDVGPASPADPTAVLLTALRATVARAMAVSGADDLPREYVNVLLPLMPELAGDLLLAMREGDYGEGYLMRDHAPLLACHARAAFLSRLTELRLPVSPVEVLADAAAGLAPGERGELRALAQSLLDGGRFDDFRLRARLAWARLEAGEERERLVDDAIALLRDASPYTVCRAVHGFLDVFGPRQREALRAIVDRLPRAGLPGDDALRARLALAAPGEAPGLVRQIMARAVRRATPALGYLTAATSLLGKVDLALLLPWFERRLREIRERPSYQGSRDLRWLLREAGALLPEGLLADAEACFRGLSPSIETRVETLAMLARHLPARRAALRGELAAEVERVVGDPSRRADLTDEEERNYFNVDALRAGVAFLACEHFDGEARASLLRRGLALVERTPTGVEHRYDFDHLAWDRVGRAADGAMFDEAVRVALSIRFRPAALKALGELVAAAPEGRRHAALLGLARLAEETPPEGRAAAVAALERALLLGPGEPTHPTRADRAAEPTAPDDDALVAAFAELNKVDDGTRTRRLEQMLDAMSPAQARRAAEHLLAEPRGYLQRNLALRLAGHDVLHGTSERAGLLAAYLRERPGLCPPYRGEVRDLTAALLSLCPAGDAAWAARLAPWFAGCAWDTEELLGVLEVTAPLLLRLGGRRLARELLPLLTAPTPAAAFARPWAAAALGAFDA